VAALRVTLDEVLGTLTDGTLDSTGHFQIDEERALDEVRATATGHPGGWMLLAVQSAVALGATRVQLLLGRNETVRIDVAEPRSIEELRDALLWGRSLSQKTRLVSTPTGLFIERPGRSKGSREALLERLALCPLPVFLEGEEISTGVFLQGQPLHYVRYVLPESEQGPRFGVHEPRRIQARHYLVQGRHVERPAEAGAARYPILEVIAEQGSHELELSDFLRISLPFDYRLSGGRIACRALLTRHSHNESSRCIPVRRGVKLDPLPLRDLYGWTVLVAIDELPTDLSQFRLVRDERCDQLLRWCEQTIAAIHHNVITNLLD
jgi:hypothetical protein